jgi:hypothetical protein
MTYVLRGGAVYRRVADVEVSYDALPDDAKFLVDMWLKQTSKKPGTPEYEQFRKKMIMRALEMGEVATGLDKRFNPYD